jgi:UDP-N-acetylglucosamine 2-epimerase
MIVASVVGARPNFIKLAPLSRVLRAAGVTEVLIHTGQHYDYQMDKIFFDELHIPAPDYHLGVGSGSHGEQTGAMLRGIEQILITEKPEYTITFGDTNTTLAGALAAAKIHIPVAHVEAGLRSFDRRMPEEVNRVLVDHCSDLLFCPTPTAVKNLSHEGIVQGVSLTGDVMADILHECIGIAERSSQIVETLSLTSKRYLLATVHRAENTDDPARLRSIVSAFVSLSEEYPVVFPCHPRTEGRLRALDLWNTLLQSVRVIPPVGYLDMLRLERHARYILTDSGGIQKEAFFLQVPCVTLRDTTEWVETVEQGWNVLAGADTERILAKVAALTSVRSPAPLVFGDASGKIRDILLSS